MKEKMNGRPSKVTLENKKLILHRFCINAGAASVDSLSKHGRFTRLAEFAHTIGYETLQDYDFANDKSFRSYLDEYLSREKQRKADHSKYVGSVYAPLDLSHFFCLSKQEQHDILLQRETYYSGLYESSAQALETYEDMSKKYSAMMAEKAELSQEVEKLRKERDDLKQLISSYKSAIQDLTKDNAYYRKRVAQSFQTQAVFDVDNENVITGSTSFTSLIAADQKLRDQDDADIEFEKLHNSINEIKKKEKQKMNTQKYVSDDPRLLAEWHPTKNGDLKPDQVALFSNRKAWWMCEKGHDWEAVAYSRSAGEGCPYCSNHRVWAGFNDLASKRPDLAAEWHPTKNGSLTSDMVTVSSNKKVWWLCSRGHDWEATVCSRSRGNGCPYCSNQKVWAGFNDLASKRPDLAAEWHPFKNIPLTPDQVTVTSHKKVWWFCEHGHEWQEKISNRARASRCPCERNIKKYKGKYQYAT